MLFQLSRQSYVSQVMESTVKGRIQRYQCELKTLDFNLVQALIDNCFMGDEIRTIVKETSSEKKAEILAELLWESSEETNIKFCTTISGLYPQLFHVYMKRSPKDQETGW